MYIIIGVIFGSFFCVVSERWPVRKNFWTSRSCCPHCARHLAFYELVPVVSFLLLRGKCRTCHTAIPRLYLHAEIIYGWLVWAIFSTSVFVSPYPKGILLLWLTMAFMLSLTDIFYMVVDSVMLLSFSLLLWLVLWLSPIEFHWLTALICLSLYLFFRQSPFIGEGDLLLFISWFPWLSFYQIHLLLLIASLTGIFYYLITKFLLKHQVVEMPFIPFLSIGLLICFI